MSKLPKYVPGVNDPILPPQLSEFKDKTTDEVLEELNRMPFFMTKLDDSDGNGGSNVTLDALKALAYEGEPHEIAENFKKQGNEAYKLKQYRNARVLYERGIEVNCNNDKINELLFVNKAACELEMKNYRSCINDCKKALSFNPLNVKCYFRMAKAFSAIEKYDESRESIEFGLKVDSRNSSLLNLLKTIIKKQEEKTAYRLKLEREKQEKEGKMIILENAIKLRNIKIINTDSAPDLLKEAKFSLEDPMDFESQLIFPAIAMFPTTDEFDFIASVSELTTVGELLDLLMDRPSEWFAMEKHRNFSSKKLVAYMETLAGGLVKVGKKLSFHEIFKMDTPKIPMFDDAAKIYLVPKVDSDDWLVKWDKSSAIEKRI
ncbi:hypothetical protein TPHA_0L01420 [Tetrapisispora phaffii CBS 4417]|uniref:Cns1/TTC4 wheel domain-containing protein n=1 Tax=Tetrapisispora phaffii (strain ATCC 24235 / CBS 4417 / NBRC 1672 / NRRL Y-8282 / UCD 70-5) TaxID=1071381 RepID=G8C019_TETPH|nr:hypothetical protein TPHA_0L01420 [Tetrapisispora phaffii CBS 4417]CCE65497.1 hypothetical protein TPHA_0L01420 [Tetrapisispora phaffii CBS 4417]